MATARKSLRQVLSEIRRLRSPLRDAISDDIKPENETPISPDNVQIVSEVMPSPTLPGETTYRPDQTPRWKLVPEVGTFVLGLVFASIYYCQWQEMQRATNDTLKTQVALNRARIVPIANYINWDNLPQDKGTPSVFVRQSFQNVGDSTALETKVQYGWGYVPLDSDTKFQGFVFYPWGLAKGKFMDGQDQWSKMPLSDLRKAKQAIAQRIPFYIYVRITYNDVLPVDCKAGHPRQDHLVEANIPIVQIDTGEASEGKSTTWVGSTKPEELHLCSDDQCPNYKNYAQQ